MFDEALSRLCHINAVCDKAKNTLAHKIFLALINKKVLFDVLKC